MIVDMAAVLLLLWPVTVMLFNMDRRAATSPSNNIYTSYVLEFWYRTPLCVGDVLCRRFACACLFMTSESMSEPEAVLLNFKLLLAS